MLKSVIAASAGLIFSAAAFGQNDPATKPVVFVVGPVETGSASISSAGNPKVATDLLGDCPGIQVSGQEAGSDYTIRMSPQDGSKSRLQVLNASGVIVASGLAGDARNALKDACSIVLSDYFSNGRSGQPVLAPDVPLVPVPALASETKLSSPGQPAASAEPVSVGFSTVAEPARVSASTVPIASQSEPAAPRTPSTSPALGTIHGTTISAPDPNAAYQASEPQQTESLGEIARRNRAAKAARQQQAQQAQNDAKPNDNPH
ncbi:MAG TPA: hypothetical protein VK525_14685 [Candidatus Saccharimonadales bacterium]|nr:hypothetical protein [Candidatus Saccharimonadales bacterium]